MFTQDPPELGNQYEHDRVLKRYLQRTLPGNVLEDISGDLQDLGALSGGELYQQQLNELNEKPALTRWDAWGNRIDTIKLTPLWEKAARLAAEYGIVAAGYEDTFGRWARVHQLALAYLFIPSTDMYGCPLAMADGAAWTLLQSDNEELIKRAVPHLTSRDPSSMFTSGQWMTETTGGSDVSRTETSARQQGERWYLHGRKWFTSAITADIALALARPEHQPEGSSGLALFYVPVRNNGRLQDGIRVDRLKDKLGTQKLPTAELTLEGARAIPVGELRGGTRAIAPMLNITRMWNAVTAVAYMRRCLALAQSYARKRKAFGRSLIDQPLHATTLARMQSTFEACFQLTFRMVELRGQLEKSELDKNGKLLLRVLTPVAKLFTAKKAVELASETLEAFGGAGYIENTGLPMLLRDAQVLPIWEGTTNVLSLDLLRVLSKLDDLGFLRDEWNRCVASVNDEAVQVSLETPSQLLDSVIGTYREVSASGNQHNLQALARDLAFGIGGSLSCALLARQAQWCLNEHADNGAAASLQMYTHSELPRQVSSHDADLIQRAVEETVTASGKRPR